MPERITGPGYSGRPLRQLFAETTPAKVGRTVKGFFSSVAGPFLHNIPVEGKKILAETKNAVKRSEKQKFDGAKVKVSEVANKRFRVYTAEAEVEAKQGRGLCFGGSAYFLKQWLEQDVKDVKEVSSSFRGGMPADAGFLHMQSSHIYTNAYEGLLPEEKKDANHTASHFQEFEAKYRRGEAHEARAEYLKVIENDPDKEFKIYLLDSFEKYLKTGSQEQVYHRLHDSALSKYETLTIARHAVIVAISQKIENVNLRPKHVCIAILQYFGFSTPDYALGDFYTFTKALSQLDDGAYMLGTPTYSLFSDRGAHALALIIDAGTAYLYDPNMAIWEVPKEKISTLGERVLWTYMDWRVTDFNTMSIIRVELPDSGGGAIDTKNPE